MKKYDVRTANVKQKPAKMKSISKNVNVEPASGDFN